MRPPRPQLAALLLLLTSQAGCASYAPAPLPEAPASTRDADLSLARQAEALAPSRLAPLTIDLAAPLTPDQVAVLAVLVSPDLKAARAKAGVADAQAFNAGLLPDPTLTLGADFPTNGAGSITALTGALGLDLGALRTRGVKVAQADRAAAQAHLDLAWAEWSTAAQARLLASRIVALEQQQALADRGWREIADLLARSSRAALRGDLKMDDLTARRLAAASAQDQLQALERSALTARGDLAKLTGLAIEELPRLAPAPPSDPRLPDAGRLFALARDNRLDLAALRKGYDSQDAAYRQAILEQYPNVTLTVTGARDTSDVRTLGPAVSLNLPLWNRNQGVVAVQSATREQLRQEYQARLSGTRAEIEAALALLAVSIDQRAALEAQLVPLRAQLAAMEAAVRRGDLAASVADDLRQSVTARELALAAADQTLNETLAGLETSIGLPRDRWL